MNLTDDDKQLLKEWGYSKTNIIQIEEAAQRANTSYELQTPDGLIKKISRETVLSTLGRKKYLAGLCRSAFHVDATIETNDNGFVFFDSRRLFKKA